MPITMVRAENEKENVGLCCCPILYNILYYIILIFPICYKHEVFGFFQAFPNTKLIQKKKDAVPDKVIY